MSGFKRAFGMVKRSSRPDGDVKLDAAQILSALPLAVMVLDHQDNICSVNYAAEEFFGSSKALLLNTGLSEILPARPSGLPGAGTRPRPGPHHRRA